MADKSKLLVLTDHEERLAPLAQQAENAGYTVLMPAIDTWMTLSSQDLSDVSVVLEWLPKANQCKQRVLTAIISQIPEDSLVYSASHEVMAGTAASWISSPERLIGFSPMGIYRESKLMNLVKTPHLSELLQLKAEAFWQSLDYETAWIQDTPGMVLPRIYAMLANEAAFALQESVATASDIDTAMRLGTNYPMGPLEWADNVGLDTVLAILQNLWEVYREERYRPCLMLQRLVSAGSLGRSSGKGFYCYPSRACPSEPLESSKIKV